MIEVLGVEKKYGGRVVLAPTSLQVGSAERLVMVGPSGSGKSTLLRTIVGLVAPDRGTVKVGGVTMSPETAGGLRLRMGYVIQEGGLFPHLRNDENVTLLARRRGRSAAQIAARVAELVDLVRIDPALLGRYPLQSSGGERQRVGLMRALMLDPDVLLLDEPMAALDPMVRAHLQDDLLGIMNRLSKCVVLVTHDMAEAAMFGHRIGVMRAGAIVQMGTLHDLQGPNADPFVAEFIGAQRGLARFA